MDAAAERAFRRFASARLPAVWPGGGVLWITDATRGTLTCVDPRTARVRGVRSFDDTGLLVADAVGLYSVIRAGLVQVAPASVCHG